MTCKQKNLSNKCSKNVNFVNILKKGLLRPYFINFIKFIKKNIKMSNYLYILIQVIIGLMEDL